MGPLPSVHLPVYSVQLVAGLNVKAVVERVMLLPNIHDLFEGEILLSVVHLFITLGLPQVGQLLLRYTKSRVHYIEKLILVVWLNQVLGELVEDHLGFALIRGLSEVFRLAWRVLHANCGQ